MVVDCRAIYSVAPAGALRRTGVELQETQVFGPAKGESVRRRMGEVPYEIGDRGRAARVIFGRRGDACCLAW